MKIIDLLVTLIENVIREPGKYLIPGHNGPYNDPETSVRNYGHWLITFSKCYEFTGEQIYLDKVRELAEYLVSEKSRPYGFSFHHRSKEGKDRCNGLVGQAWTIEALQAASSTLGERKYSQIAGDVFFQHKFIENLGLWRCLDIDGNDLVIDPTFNHQLWFAACASKLKSSRRNKILNRVICFLDKLNLNLTLLDNGLIYHPIINQININENKLSLRPYLRNIAKELLSFIRQMLGKTNNLDRMYQEKMVNKSIGYHQFNMYAFGQLKESVPDHPFWQSKEYKKSIKFLLSDEFKNGVRQNIYGFPYNPPGFEVPYALSMFPNLDAEEIVEISTWWINEQFNRSYNPETTMMDRNTDDTLTHTARIYEITRLPISILKRIKIDIQSIDDFSEID